MEAESNQPKWIIPDDDVYARHLIQADLWRGPGIRKLIHALALPEGSSGLDAGCGIGQHTLWLADAVGERGHVTGMDLSPDFVARAADLAQDAGLSPQTSFQAGDLNHLPFANDSFDWLWSADTIYFGPPAEGYVSQNPSQLIQELSRVVRPGGRLILVYCAAQNLLPGFPLLEAKLNVASAQAESFVRNSKPFLHHMRAGGWLRGAGLLSITSCTVGHGIMAPLDGSLRDALMGLIQMRWGSDLMPKLDPEDRDLYTRLCSHDSPDFILDLPDYASFFTCTQFTGIVPE